MKLTHVLVAGTALISASALAGGNQAQQRSQSEQPAQQSSASQGASQQTQQSQSQSPEIVKQAQKKLSAAGHDAGPADGVLGAKTQAAVKDFQQSEGIQASGQLDTQTLAALQIDASQGSASTGSSASSSTGESAGAGASGQSAGSSPPERTTEPKSKY